MGASGTVQLDDTINEDEAFDQMPQGKGKNARPTGKVIGIIKRNWRNYCGVLLPTSNVENTRHLFVPSEKRIPR